ncbi:glycosyltransferase family 2 protein [soil metagenome]
MNRQISIVILNWNAADDTIRCIGQMDQWQQVQAQIWVVDNHSQDNSVAEITSACPHVHLIRNQANLGFAGGTNRGLQAALVKREHPVLLLNNDALVDETAIAQLLQTLTQDRSIGMVGPLLYHAEQRDQLIAAGSQNPVWHLQNLIKTIPADQSTYAVNYISGSVALVRAEALRRVGWLDEDYFFYTEVADWCQRARQQGYRTVVDPQARAYHNLNRSAPARNALYVYYLIRNRFIYIHKAYHQFYRWLRLPLYAFWTLYCLLLTLQLRIKGNAARSKAVWVGLTDGLSGRWGGQNERVLALCAQAAGSIQA